MKRIKLRHETIGPPGAEGPFDWVDVIRQIIQKPLDPQKGVDIEEMRKSIKLLDIVDGSNGVLELEDSDWEYLKTKTMSMQWAVIDRHIVKLVDDIVMATEEPTL